MRGGRGTASNSSWSFAAADFLGLALDLVVVVDLLSGPAAGESAVVLESYVVPGSD